MLPFLLLKEIVMAVKRSPARTRKAVPAKVVMEYVDIHSIVPYAYNPRDNSEAIASVAKSITNFGFLVPVVVDANNVLVAGHTRVEAAKTLGLSEVPSIRAGHLTDDQINAFRLIDNKVSELAKWDFDLLSGEITKLTDSGIVLTDFGWTQSELDCLTDIVRDDCLSTENLVDLEAAERLRNLARRAPSTSRFVLGELVFFTPATAYRTWVDGLRTLHDYNDVEIIREIKHRLGIPES